MKRDITRLAVERAAERLAEAKRRVKERVPYGPDKVQLTPSELRERISKMGAVEVDALVKELGAQEFLKVLRGKGVGGNHAAE